jgi:formylglycine-generating enzyme required for sulfatase activity
MQHEPNDPDGPAECCVAGDHEGTAALPTNPYGDTSPATADTARMAEVPGGTFEMGTDDDVGFPADGEGPRRTVDLDPFYVDRHQVTNAEFYQFVTETGYTTDAERFGWSFVFRDFLGPEAREHVVDAAGGASWWLAVEGANWFRPEGPGSSVVEDRLKHPVVHVSWRDAVEYARWADKRLPTEAEWERAARGGLAGKRFPWGDELCPDGEHRCNIWQGDFPGENTAEDGYRGTAPVDAFRQNEFGLYNVSGNVWEWCADWFTTDHPEAPLANPTGPADGDGKVIRGGSYLCHDSYCNRYRVAARSSTPPTSTTGNCGFRCAVDG